MRVSYLNQTNNLDFKLKDISTNKALRNRESFSDFLKSSLENVSSLEKESEEYTVKLATGELENIHEAMITAQKADIALQFTMQIRNKVLDAYNEIMRMQI